MASSKGVEWQQLSVLGSCPEITRHSKPIWKNRISENTAFRLQLRRKKWFINLSGRTQTLLHLICISTGADHYNKLNIYMCPPPTKREVICIYFIVCLIIPETLALNTLMASTLDLRRCWWSWLCVFLGNCPCLLVRHPSYHSRSLFFADLTIFLNYFWQ